MQEGAFGVASTRRSLRARLAQELKRSSGPEARSQVARESIRDNVLLNIYSKHAMFSSNGCERGDY